MMKKRMTKRTRTKTKINRYFPNAKVIVHLSNGWDNALFRWNFDGLQTYHAKFDVIGMSLYPLVTNWQQLNMQCLANLNDMVDRYNKEVMIVEAGMAWDSPQACKSFLEDLSEYSITIFSSIFI